jgi:hypothetical protein
MKFKTDEHYKKSIFIKNKLRTPSIEIEARHWADADDKEVYSVLNIQCGPTTTRMELTSDEARKLSAMLLAYADQLDDHQAQLDAESEAKAA